jgi:hypothetical protein
MCLPLLDNTASGSVWGPWFEQRTHQPIYTMDIRASSSLTREIIAPPYVPVHPLSGAPSTSMVVMHPQMQQNHFNFAPYTGAGQNEMIPAFANNYIQQRPLPRLTQSDTDRSRGMLYTRSSRQDFVEELPCANLTIKSEPQWNGPGNSPSFLSANTKILNTTSITNRSNEVNFGTEVDTLMKAIQAKSKSTTPQTTSSVDQSRPVVSVSHTPSLCVSYFPSQSVCFGESSQFKLTQKYLQEEASSPKGGKKHYQCTIENCTMSFYEKTRLDIHERFHTGVKPYVSSCSRFLRYKIVF